MGAAMQTVGNVVQQGAQYLGKLEFQKQEFEAEKLALQENHDLEVFLEEEKRKAPPGGTGLRLKTSNVKIRRKKDRNF